MLRNAPARTGGDISAAAPTARRLGGAGFVVLLAASCLLARAAHGDVVVTRDGTTYEGKVLVQDDEKVVIETTFDGTRTVPKDDVKSVDTRKPPLRDQLAFRTKQAEGDAKALWGVWQWAKKAGFETELRPILELVVVADPQHRKAREALGHEKVDGHWMSPEEKARHEEAAKEDEYRARGLVPYEGEWVTPQEKEAREKGLRKDGGDWITEEEWHRRRGERQVDGAWIRFGEAEGKAFTDLASKGSRLPLVYRWSPWFDFLGDVPEPLLGTIADGCEKAYAAARGYLKPKDDDLPESDPAQRTRVFLHVKLPAYTRLATWFAGHVKADELVKGWVGAVQRQHAWWWVQDVNAIGCYQFPSTDKTFVSNTVHQVGKLLLTIYKRDYRFPSAWLQEGFAYVLEMDAIGYSLTFTLGRGAGSQATGEDTDVPIWQDSARWREALKAEVLAGTDPPLKRLARMDLSQFRYVELVKSWSVVECLIRWDAAKFKQLIDTLKGDDPDEEKALKAVYGVDYRGLDDRWRAYVQAGFQHAR